MRKDERICKVCGRKYRIKGKGSRYRYCSSTCSAEARRWKKSKRSSLGTTTHSLTPDAVSKQLYLIRNNIDVGKRVFNSDKTVRDVYLDRSVYYPNDNEEYLFLEVIE